MSMYLRFNSVKYSRPEFQTQNARKRADETTSVSRGTCCYIDTRCSLADLRVEYEHSAADHHDYVLQQRNRAMDEVLLDYSSGNLHSGCGDPSSQRLPVPRDLRNNKLRALRRESRR